jgi:hypothetical protein
MAAGVPSNSRLVSWRQFLFHFFSSADQGTISIGFVSLSSVGVGVEAVRLVEPVEEAKVNKQTLADANKLMTDARFKGMKVAASLADHAFAVCSVAFSLMGNILFLEVRTNW